MDETALKTVRIARRHMGTRSGFSLKISEDDDEVAYLELPGHTGSAPGVIKKTIRLRDLVADYDGPDLNFDFDENNTLIGVEIIG